MAMAYGSGGQHNLLNIHLETSPRLSIPTCNYQNQSGPHKGENRIYKAYCPRLKKKS